MVDAGSGSIGWVPASYLAPVEVGNKQEVLENETLVGPEEGKRQNGSFHDEVTINNSLFQSGCPIHEHV